MTRVDKHVIKVIRAWLEGGAMVSGPILHNLVTLLRVADRLNEQNDKLENELQTTNELLADAVNEAGMRKGYAHQLKKQLIKVKEAGEPIGKFVKHLESVKADDQIVDATRRLSDRQCHGELGVVFLTYGQLRRLVQALDGISSPETKCQWTQDEDGVYHTSCDGTWQLTSGDLLENEVKFCPYCGNQIEEVKNE